MLYAELFFVAAVYITTFLYNRLFAVHNYRAYFLAGIVTWVAYLCGRTLFQLYYLQDEPAFKGNGFGNIFANNITFVVVYFLFITACKYFKGGYIAQQFEAERNEQQLVAEVNNLKSQIAPHFLFNTLNNLYGLAVDKSDKLPDLMLRLSDLLRHSLYETQKPFVKITEEISVINSYIELERLRLEENLKLRFHISIPRDAPYTIAPLILIVFVENAFKHARLVQPGPVDINIKTQLEDNLFTLVVKNNYNEQQQPGAPGIGLTNVRRRLEVLYPGRHTLTILKEEGFYTVNLQLQLNAPTNGTGEI